jgi:hypothetical protein
MFRFCSVAAGLIAGTLAMTSAANAGHDQSLYQYAVFPEGHWIGHGTLTVTHAGSAGSSTADGSFNFDLTIRKGVASGTMVEDYSGQMNHGNVVAHFDGISSGNGWTLSGNAGKVVINGTMTFTGEVTGNGHTFPIHMTTPATGGTFAPDEYTCSTASGNLATPASMGMFAGSNTTISGPWTAINVAPRSGNTKAQAEQWFATIDQVNADVAKVKAGEMTLTLAQARALIDQAQVVIAGLTSAEKCGGGSHVSAYGETFLKEFEVNLSYLQTQMKLGDFR